MRKEDLLNVEPEVRGEKNVEDDEDNDIPIANITKRIIDNVTKSKDRDTQEKNKEVVEVDEKTENGEETNLIVMKSITRYVADRVKEKKNHKYVTPKSSMKNTEVVKENNPQEKFVRKKRKVEEKTYEKKPLKEKACSNK